LRLHAEGKPSEEIAALIGSKPATVRKWIAADESKGGKGRA
jgi:predicted transcriptional regulator